MTEQEARAYVSSLSVSRGTVADLDSFVVLLKSANRLQNLVSNSTLETVWTRHLADSAQLVPLAASTAGSWLDLGSGPGFPGLIVATVASRAVTLVEERALRAMFLHSAVQLLDLGEMIDVVQSRVEKLIRPPASVISARAFAPLTRLFRIAAHLAAPETLWLLPKGRSAARELEEARAMWQGDMRLVQSVTDPDAAIIVATDIRPR